MKNTSIGWIWTVVLFAAVGVVASCSNGKGTTKKQKPMARDTKVIFLHHSTGECIWKGGVSKWFETYNKANKTAYSVKEQNFPKDSPYGWKNYPYDYWNIWIKHAGQKPYKQEPTLEILTKQYNVIVFKHCFPVSEIEDDTGKGDVSSSEKRIENYKLQYQALKKKMRQFPKTRFLVWTGATLTKENTDEASGRRAKAFFKWVRSKWDERGDNIYLWDFYKLETEGGLYMKQEHSSGGDPHPNERFSRKVSPLFAQRIVDVINGSGDVNSITGSGGKAVRTGTIQPTEKNTPAAPEKPTKQSDVPEKAPLGKGSWVFDNAEHDKAVSECWSKSAKYVSDGQNRAVQIQFATGEEQDWGEYGKHRVVRTHLPKKNYDIRRYKFMAFRVKADRKMPVVVEMVTLPKPQAQPHQPHFAFNAYLQTEPDKWKWVVLDLSKLELAVEGAGAYEKAGKPTRPEHLTLIQFAIHKKNEKTTFLIDDIVFYRELPTKLRPYLQSP